MEEVFWYQRAIEIITSDNDWKALCVSVAKNSPKSLVEAAQDQPWQAEIKLIALTDGKVAAIKRYRSMHQSSLKDAKEAVEKIMEI